VKFGRRFMMGGEIGDEYILVVRMIEAIREVGERAMKWTMECMHA